MLYNLGREITLAAYGLKDMKPLFPSIYTVAPSKMITFLIYCSLVQ